MLRRCSSRVAWLPITRRLPISERITGLRYARCAHSLSPFAERWACWSIVTSTRPTILTGDGSCRGATLLLSLHPHRRCLSRTTSSGCNCETGSNELTNSSTVNPALAVGLEEQTGLRARTVAPHQVIGSQQATTAGHTLTAK